MDSRQKIFLVLALLCAGWFSTGASRRLVYGRRGFIPDLKYGDDCSLDGEADRQNFIRSLLEGADPRLVIQGMERMKERTLCSEEELLVCDRDTRKCICGDFAFEAFHGANKTNYVLEDDKKCGRNTDTFCMPENDDDDTKCRTGTTCKTPEGDVCTERAVRQYLYKNGTTLEGLGDQVRINLLFSGALCSCKSDSVQDGAKNNLGSDLALPLPVPHMSPFGILGVKAKYAELSQALKYGDVCSWEAEEYRQNMTRFFKNSSPDPRSVEREMMTDVVNRKYKLCSESEHFVCDKETQKCVCGDPSYEVTNGIDRTLFVLEEDVGKCRWNTGAYCFTPDMFIQDESSLKMQSELPFSNLHYQCRKGTTCKTTHDDKICSMEAAIQNIRSRSQPELTSGSHLTHVQFADAMMTGEICSCKPDPSEAETHPESSTSDGELTLEEKYKQLKRALKFGDNCSWEAEAHRQSLVRLTLNASRSFSTNDNPLQNGVVERGEKLCNARGLFVCDRDTQKCVCGDPIREAIYGSVNRTNYVSPEGEGKCRWAEGSYCLGPEEEPEDVKIPMECRAGTSCKLRDGSVCTQESSVRYALENMGSLPAFVMVPAAFMKEMMSGRICTCQV